MRSRGTFDVYPDPRLDYFHFQLLLYGRDYLSAVQIESPRTAANSAFRVLVQSWAELRCKFKKKSISDL